MKNVHVVFLQKKNPIEEWLLGARSSILYYSNTFCDIDMIYYGSLAAVTAIYLCYACQWSKLFRDMYYIVIVWGDTFQTSILN